MTEKTNRPHTKFWFSSDNLRWVYIGRNLEIDLIMTTLTIFINKEVASFNKWASKSAKVGST